MRSKRLVYIILLIACCFPAHHVFCQPIENHFTHYTTKDGLADGTIGSIIQDSSGFLWVGCGNGLSRFDGHTFKTYRHDPHDTNSLRENRICQLYIDSEKRLWIISFHWLYLYHPEGDWFEHFNISWLINDNINKIITEENGQLIIGGNKSLYKFDIQHKKIGVFYFEGINPNIFWNYKKDEDGVAWIGTGQGLFRYDPKTKKSMLVDSVVWKNKLKFNIVHDLLLLPDGYLLAATYNCGLYTVNLKTNAIKRFLPDKNDSAAVIGVIYKYNDSLFLLGTDYGLCVFNRNTGQFTYLKPDRLNPTSLLEDDTHCFFCDREGIIWLGGAHLEKYDFKDYNVKIISPNAIGPQVKLFYKYFSIYKCIDGKFLLGSYWGAAIYDPTTCQLKKINNKKLNNKIIEYLQEDGSGNVWCNTTLFDNSHPQICVFNIKNGQAENIKQYDIPSSNSINNMKLDQKGHVLIATADKGLVIFDTVNKTFTFFSVNSKPSSQLTNSTTTAICEDHNGCVWVGTIKGINKIEKDGITVKQYSQNKKRSSQLPDWCITGIREDKHGIIWFSTREHGIGRIDPQNDSVSFISIAQGLPTCMLYHLYIDSEDNLWATSKLGIVNLNVVTLQNKLYTEDEGFPSPDDIINIHYSKYTKKLYILTPYSIYEIDAKNTTHKNDLLQTAITGFSVFDNEKNTSVGKDILLDYNENFINIQFAYLLFHSNKQIKYAYKMDGIDKDWVYCNYKRNAPYTNLPPGHYTFYVKAQSPDGIWNSPTLLTIIIKPPLWQTWWFYLAEGIAVLACAFWVVRFYTERKLAKQKNEIDKLLAVSNERARIAADIHDELGAGLTSVRMLSESAGGKIKQHISPGAEIEKIERYATNLSDNLREIIWTMNTRFDKLNDFIIYIRAYAVEYFEDSPIKFQFIKPAIIPELVMSGELRRNLFLCIKEALNNVVKHSHATEASLTFNMVGNTITIEIMDNGIGIDMGQTNKFGNGLSTMKERLQKFGSDLTIEINNGTVLTFKINITVQ